MAVRNRSAPPSDWLVALLLCDGSFGLIASVNATTPAAVTRKMEACMQVPSRAAIVDRPGTRGVGKRSDASPPQRVMRARWPGAREGMLGEMPPGAPRVAQVQLALLGAAAAAVQTLFSREILADFSGNEAVLASVLGAWL